MMKSLSKVHTFNFFWYLTVTAVLFESCYIGWHMSSWAWDKAIDIGLLTHSAAPYSVEVKTPYRVEVEQGDTLQSIAFRVATSDRHLSELTQQIQQAAGVDDHATLQPGKIITFTLSRKEVLHND